MSYALTNIEDGQIVATTTATNRAADSSSFSVHGGDNGPTSTSMGSGAGNEGAMAIARALGLVVIILWL